MKCSFDLTVNPSEALLFNSRAEENSMLYWYPLVKDLPIPQPETVIVPLSKNSWELAPICDGDLSPLKDDLTNLDSQALKIGYPLFMRTDEFSGKHFWDDCCYVEKPEALLSHLASLIENSLIADMMGLPIRAIVFRKFLLMETIFTAFCHHTPINVEVRVFVNDGKVVCKHWYWVEQAIEEGTPEGRAPMNWRIMLRLAKDSITSTEYELLDHYATLVAEKVPGFWSVDFCKGRNGDWFLIDMAVGNMSFHPEV